MATGTLNNGDYTLTDDSNGDWVLKEPDGNIIKRWDDSAGDWYINDSSGTTVIQYDSSAGEIQFNSNALSGVSTATITTVNVDDIDVTNTVSGLSATAVSNLEGDNLSVDGSGYLNATGLTDGAYDAVSTVTSNYTASDNEAVLGDASGGAITVTLPSPANAVETVVKKIDSSTNAVTIATPGSETIDGQSSIDISNQYYSRTITSDGSNYFIL